MNGVSRAGGNKPDFHFGSIKNPISLIECEHDRVENVKLDIMRTIADNYELSPDADDDTRQLYDSLRVLEKEIRRHIYLENKACHERIYLEVIPKPIHTKSCFQR